MQLESGEGQRINAFALVSYIPDPLGSFLDRLRVELSPGCLARVHVTVLPPRPLVHPPEETWLELQSALQEIPPFTLEPTEVQVFPVTSVIFLAIGEGFHKLKDLHHLLNRSKAGFAEPFPFHPHITLAQDLAPDQVAPAAQLAKARWEEFAHDRHITV
ncbi:MAG: 2'-5' RNA ligase family protein, partial [Bryobacteraceae bacterium]